MWKVSIIVAVVELDINLVFVLASNAVVCPSGICTVCPKSLISLWIAIWTLSWDNSSNNTISSPCNNEESTSNVNSIVPLIVLLAVFLVKLALEALFNVTLPLESMVIVAVLVISLLPCDKTPPSVPLEFFLWTVPTIV